MAQQVESKNRATSTEEARKDALKKIKDDGVEFLLLWFTDLEGHLKSFAVTPARSRAPSTTVWGSTARRSPASTRSRSRT